MRGRRATTALFVVLAACSSAGSDAAYTAANTTAPITSPSPPSTSNLPTTIASTSTSSTTSTTTTPISPPSSATTTQPREAETILSVCWEAPVDDSPGVLAFTDATQAMGLIEPLLGMRGHAAGLGDINGDGWPDLIIGTFADRPVEDYAVRGADGRSPDRFLLGGASGFRLDPSFAPRPGRTSGVALADLDGDDDLDVVLARNYRDNPQGSNAPTTVFENDGGRLTPATELAPDLGARSIGVLDYDGDGSLDLFIVEDRWSGGRTTLFRNLGDFRFEDVTISVGLPDYLDGLGVGVADLTGDSWPELFVSGSNRLFVANGDGTFREATSPVFEWEPYGNEDDPAGVAIVDMNRDGLLDLVIGQHYNSTLEFDIPTPIRLYLNEGNDSEGNPQFRDVTEEAQLPGLPTKAPHVEIADFDSDGWPDILTTASTSDGTQPLIFRHQGLEAGVPRFSLTGVADHPQYWVTGGTFDADRDGRLDVLVIEWEPSLPSRIFHNEGQVGHWLSVEAVPEVGSGLGSTVRVYEAGELGNPDALIGSQPLAASTGYGAGSLARARFGLGARTTVDVEVLLPNGGGTWQFPHLPVDRYVRLPDGCDT